MKSLRYGLTALALTLCACTTSQTGDAQSAVRKAASVSLTTYADVFQPAVIVYGRLPDCPGPVLCKDRALLTKLQAADKTATAAIVAAKPILDGSAVDLGQLATAISAIQDAEAAIANSGALKLKP